MKDISLICPINGLSYGIVSQNILEQLSKQYRVSLFPIGGIETDNAELIQRSINNTQFFNPNATCLRIFHQFSMAERVGKGKFIGWPIFELDAFTPRELHHLACLDEIIVCSKWAKEIVLKSLPKAKVHVVPLGVNPNVFYPIDEPAKTVFFTCGKIEVRKSHYEIVQAFNQAFSIREPNVELWCMWHNPFMSEQEQDEWNNWVMSTPHGKQGNIKIIPPVKTQQEVAQIMRQTTCGVFPSKAEGWCMPLLEMMACNKPCITTNYSGQTEFVNKDNSILIQPSGLIEAYAPPWFHGGGNWCTFNIEDLINAFKRVKQIPFSLPKPRQSIINLTWQNTFEKLNEIL